MKEVLIVIVIAMLFVGACASPSAPQEPKPAPPIPSPPPEPTPPPKPPKPPEAPQYIVTVLLFEGFTFGFDTGHESLQFQGKIRNDSQDVLQDLTAYITVYDKDGNVQGQEFRMINERALYSGEISEFSMPMNDYVNGAYAKLSFELPETGVLELQLESGVPKELWKPALSKLQKEKIREGGDVVDWIPG